MDKLSNTTNYNHNKVLVKQELNINGCKEENFPDLKDIIEYKNMNNFKKSPSNCFDNRKAISGETQRLNTCQPTFNSNTRTNSDLDININTKNNNKMKLEQELQATRSTRYLNSILEKNKSLQNNLNSRIQNNRDQESDNSQFLQEHQILAKLRMKANKNKNQLPPQTSINNINYYQPNVYLNSVNNNDDKTIGINNYNDYNNNSNSNLNNKINNLYLNMNMNVTNFTEFESPSQKQSITNVNDLSKDMKDLGIDFILKSNNISKKTINSELSFSKKFMSNHLIMRNDNDYKNNISGYIRESKESSGNDNDIEDNNVDSTNQTFNSDTASNNINYCNVDNIKQTNYDCNYNNNFDNKLNTNNTNNTNTNTNDQSLKLNDLDYNNYTKNNKNNFIEPNAYVNSICNDKTDHIDIFCISNIQSDSSNDKKISNGKKGSSSGSNNENLNINIDLNSKTDSKFKRFFSNHKTDIENHKCNYLINIDQNGEMNKYTLVNNPSQRNHHLNKGLDNMNITSQANYNNNRCISKDQAFYSEKESIFDNVSFANKKTDYNSSNTGLTESFQNGNNKQQSFSNNNYFNNDTFNNMNYMNSANSNVYSDKFNQPNCDSNHYNATNFNNNQRNTNNRCINNFASYNDNNYNNSNNNNNNNSNNSNNSNNIFNNYDYDRNSTDNQYYQFNTNSFNNKYENSILNKSNCNNMNNSIHSKQFYNYKVNNMSYKTQSKPQQNHINSNVNFNSTYNNYDAKNNKDFCNYLLKNNALLNLNANSTNNNYCAYNNNINVSLPSNNRNQMSNYNNNNNLGNNYFQQEKVNINDIYDNNNNRVNMNDLNNNINNNNSNLIFNPKLSNNPTSVRNNYHSHYNNNNRLIKTGQENSHNNNKLNNNINNISNTLDENQFLMNTINNINEGDCYNKQAFNNKERTKHSNNNYSKNLAMNTRNFNEDELDNTLSFSDDASHDLSEDIMQKKRKYEKKIEDSSAMNLLVSIKDKHLSNLISKLNISDSDSIDKTILKISTLNSADLLSFAHTKKGSQIIQWILEVNKHLAEAICKNPKNSKNKTQQRRSSNEIQLNSIIQKLLLVVSDLLENQFSSFTFQRLVPFINFDQRIQIWMNSQNMIAKLCTHKIGNRCIQEMISHVESEKEELIVLSLFPTENSSALLNISNNEYGFYVILEMIEKFSANGLAMILHKVSLISHLLIVNKFGVNIIKKVVYLLGKKTSDVKSMNNNQDEENENQAYSFEMLKNIFMNNIISNLNMIVKYKYGYYGIIFLIETFGLKSCINLVKSFIYNVEEFCISSFSYKIIKKIINYSQDPVKNLLICKIISNIEDYDKIMSYKLGFRTIRYCLSCLDNKELSSMKNLINSFSSSDDESIVSSSSANYSQYQQQNKDSNFLSQIKMNKLKLRLSHDNIKSLNVLINKFITNLQKRKN